MADFKASYGEMETMSGKLDSGREEIGDVLRRLKGDVDRCWATTSRRSTRRASSARATPS